MTKAEAQVKATLNSLRDQDYLFPSAAQSSFNLVTLTILLNSGILYLNLLALLFPLISLNLLYCNVIRMLSEQIMTLLTLKPGSQSAANASGHVIFY